MSQRNRLDFVPTAATAKTKRWEVVTGDPTKRIRLGDIRWYPAWRRYVFAPDHYTLFDASCLSELTVFLEEQMMVRRAAGDAGVEKEDVA